MTEPTGRQLVINATILNQDRLTGLGVYAINILNHILPLISADRYFERTVLLGSEKLLPKRLRLPEGQSDFNVLDIDTVDPIKRLWALNAAMHRLRSRAQTTFYSTTHHGLVISGCRQVITIFDLFARLFPDNYPAQSRYFEWYLPRLLSRSETVVAASGQTESDLRRFYKRLPDVKVVPAALDEGLLNTSPERVDDIPEGRFVLFVGPGYRYKNCDRLIRAFGALWDRRPDDKLSLVFAGGREPYLKQLIQLVEEELPHLGGRIRFLGHVTPGQLVQLYQEAAVVAITTLYEGFGLPALEGMHFGVPVLASNRGSLPEVCGKAALLVEPEDISAISSGLEKLLFDDQLRARLVSKGKENLRRFSWSDAARTVYELLCEVASGKARSQ